MYSLTRFDCTCIRGKRGRNYVCKDVLQNGVVVQFIFSSSLTRFSITLASTHNIQNSIRAYIGRETKTMREVCACMTTQETLDTPYFQAR